VCGGGGGGKSGPLRQNECGIRRVVVDSKFQRGVDGATVLVVGKKNLQVFIPIQMPSSATHNALATSTSNMRTPWHRPRRLCLCSN
jgi:hypothetical protein